MSNHDELIERLRASAAAMPFDAAVAVQYRAAADALEGQARPLDVPLAWQDVRRPDSVAAEVDTALPGVNRGFRVQRQGQAIDRLAQLAHGLLGGRLVGQDGDEIIHVAHVVAQPHVVLGDVIEAVEHDVRGKLAG